MSSMTQISATYGVALPAITPDTGDHFGSGRGRTVPNAVTAKSECAACTSADPSAPSWGAPL